jgi:hypothetical protein
MNPEIKARWVAALRGGEYGQGHGHLHGREGSMCCLGVLCDLHANETGGGWRRGGDGYDLAARYLGERNYLPEEVVRWSGLPDRTGGLVEIRGAREKLPVHNDAGRTFAEIADAIEAQL